jgi:hypothetical protein
MLDHRCINDYDSHSGPYGSWLANQRPVSSLVGHASSLLVVLQGFPSTFSSSSSTLWISRRVLAQSLTGDRLGTFITRHSCWLQLSELPDLLVDPYSDRPSCRMTTRNSDCLVSTGCLRSWSMVMFGRYRGAICKVSFSKLWSIIL